MNDEEEFKLNINFKDFMTIEYFVIVILLFLMLLMYIIHTKEIEKCNIFYQEMMKNNTFSPFMGFA